LILITGGAGYIGSHTAISLLNNEEDILIVDNLKNSSIKSIERIKKITGKSFKFYQGDIRDENFLLTIFQKYQIKDVIHFAGLKSVGDSNNNPIEYYDNNVLGLLSLLKIMLKFDCKNIVFSSSATVYGIPKKLPIKEDSFLSTINPYGRSKLMIENILKDLYKSDTSWNICILRYFNPVGAHESGLIGEDPNDTPTNLFPLVSRVAAGLLDYVEIYGNDYPTEDGTGIRDYIHVCDLADGHNYALKQFRSEGSIYIFNLGTGNGYSVLEIIKEFEKVSNKKINYKFVNRRSGDVASCYADPTYAKEYMNWSAKFSLKKMCEDQWKWQKSSDY
jgi:UDP-glucose 4-epimerase